MVKDEACAIFKKVGKGLKKVAKKVGTVVKKVGGGLLGKIFGRKKAPGQAE